MNKHSTSDKQTDSFDKFREILNDSLKTGNLAIPILPKTANEVLQMSQDPNADMTELSKLIHQDQSIAGSVLRISNSAAFAASERIVSLQQSISRLGMQLLSEIALSVAVQSNVFSSPKYKEEIKLMWKHSLASAVYGKEIARFLRRNVEGQYLCGLLHTIGKPVVLKAIEGLEDDINVTLDKKVAIKLVEEFHIVAGILVTSKWNLPKTVQIANKYYQEYENAPEFKLETAVTYLSDQLAQSLIFPGKINDKNLIFDPVFETLNIYPNDRGTLLEKKEDVQLVVNSMTF